MKTTKKYSIHHHPKRVIAKFECMRKDWTGKKCFGGIFVENLPEDTKIIEHVFYDRTSYIEISNSISSYTVTCPHCKGKKLIVKSVEKDDVVSNPDINEKLRVIRVYE